jgi:hypothetical protein
MPKVGIDDLLVSHQAGAADLDALPRKELWPQLDPVALDSVAGDFVTTIAPLTEADPVAVLGHLLTSVGNVIGPRPHARVQYDRHPARLNMAFVGRTSKGRKGLALSPVRHVLAQVCPDWARARIKTGLSSGEGLIYHVRDPREELRSVKKNREVVQQAVLVDAGESDKRLLIVEPELAVVLKRMGAEGNSLSGVMRLAWDSGDLSTLTKNAPMTATGAHISVVAHITEEELRRHLTEAERANGFGNRFIWLLVRRSKLLPAGPQVPEHQLKRLIHDVDLSIEAAQRVDEMKRTPGADRYWTDIYPSLSAEEPGMVGAILSRAEAQVLRLSVIYALLDRSERIRLSHLKAAHAFWQYAEASVRRIFGNRIGAPIADMILGALQTRGPLPETAIWDLLGRHRTAEELHVALDSLERTAKARQSRKSTRGRPAVIWEAI